MRYDVGIHQEHVCARHAATCFDRGSNLEGGVADVQISGSLAGQPLWTETDTPTQPTDKPTGSIREFPQKLYGPRFLSTGARTL